MTTNALTTPAPINQGGNPSGAPSPESPLGKAPLPKADKGPSMTPVALSTWADLWKPPPQEKSPRAGAVETWREVIDTIVFVVVLVLILKSFVAECFVIPTGSMAETLYGYHKLVDCPSCGLRYSVNCSQEVENPELGQRTSHGVCPNCLQHVDLELPRQRANEFHKSIPDPGPSTGDRVLVSKFFNDLLGLPYLRWAVVVFKFPGNSHPKDFASFNPAYPISGPQKEHTAMNYIKRLIGLPNEWIAIHGGDLYVMSGVAPPQPEKPVRDIDLWKFENMWENAGQEDFRQGKFKILRKPATAVVAESRLVYDHDHPPSDLTSMPRWIALQGGVDAEGNTGFLVKGAPEKKGPVWLRYQHLLRGNIDPSTGQPRKQLITDIMGYNDISNNMGRGFGNNWVADLMLEASIEPEQRQGAVIFELSRGPDRFQARLECDTGAIELFRITGSQISSLKKWENGGLKKAGQSTVRFANVDRALHLWVDNRLLTGAGVEYDSPLDVGPVIANDFEPASIGVEGLWAKVTHLKLSRDTYYTVRLNSPQEPDAYVNDWTAGPEVPTGDIPHAWDKLRTLPVKTFYVQPGHYLCMGDNSSHSSDGRSWGLVPHRLMLGQAVAIYYPILRMGKIR